MGIGRLILRRLWTGSFKHRECSHLDLVKEDSPATRDCEECVALGDGWPDTRMCLVCGYVGCCDRSKNKHMLRHHEATGHPVIGPAKPGNNWVWCYVDKALI